MNPWARRALKVVTATLLLLALLVLSLGLFVRSARFQDWLRAELAARTGAAVQFSGLHLSWPLGVAADKVLIAKPGFGLQSERLSLTINPAELTANTIHRLRLEKPVLKLDVEELMKSSAQSEISTAIRQLNVQDGTVVLKLAEGNTIELPHINLNAENLNLGPSGAVTLKTDVPLLQSEADVVLSGSLRELAVTVNLREKLTRKLLDRLKAKNAAQNSLQVSAVIHAPANQQPWITLNARSSDLTLGGKKVTAQLESRLDLDTQQKELGFTAQGQLAGFPSVLSPRPLPLRDGPADFTATGRYASNNRALAIRSLELKSALGTADGDGQITLGEKVIVHHARTNLRGLSWEALKPLFPAPLNQWSYNGLADADLTLRGPLDALEVKGVARSPALSVRTPDFSLGPVELNAPLEATSASLLLQDMRLQGKSFAWKDARGNVAAEQIAIDGKLAVKEKLPVTFDGRAILSGANLKTAGGTTSSAEQLSVNGKLAYSANQPLKAGGDMRLTNAKFSSADSARVGENLTMNGNFSAVSSPANDLIALAGKLNVEAGEILWGKFFGDLKAQKPVVNFDGDYSFKEDRLACRQCVVAIANVGQLQLQGSIDRPTQDPQLKIELRSENFLPGGFFEVFLRETFNQRYPLFNKIAVGGQMTFQARLQGMFEAFEVSGELGLKNGELRAKSNDWQIGPIGLALPFQLRYPEAGQSSSEIQPGTLTIQSARFGSGSLAPIKTTLSLSNNRLRFHQPLVLTMYGGTIELANLLWPDIMKSAKDFTFAAESKQIQLQDLTESLGWPRFSGTLTASIPQITSTANVLRTNGTIRAELFGGRIDLAKLEIEDPFSSLASIKLDTALRGINLEQASKTFQFGRISGVLEGSINDLVITDGQPAQLRADLHSVDRGTEQRISVEALNKITVLSSGENAGAVYGGLAGFFDSFRYSKLGFKATLRNDKLTLRGIESRDGKEFLVVGSLLPPTVNIISYTQEIGFGELLRRLQQIKKSDNIQIK